MRVTHRQELLLLEVSQLEVRAQELRRELLPLEIRQLSLLQARERLAHPPQLVPLEQMPAPPEPVRELLPTMPEPELPSAEEQLTSLLAGPSTSPRYSPSSAS